MTVSVDKVIYTHFWLVNMFALGGVALASLAAIALDRANGFQSFSVISAGTNVG